MFRSCSTRVERGQHWGIAAGTKRDEVERGQVVAKPGSITPHTKFKAEVYILSKEEGGRPHAVFQWVSAAVLFRTTDVTGILNLPEGVEMVMPGTM